MADDLQSSEEVKKKIIIIECIYCRRSNRNYHPSIKINQLKSINQVLGKEENYNELKVPQWIENILELTIQGLGNLKKPFKYSGKFIIKNQPIAQLCRIMVQVSIQQIRFGGIQYLMVSIYY